MFRAAENGKRAFRNFHDSTAAVSVRDSKILASHGNDGTVGEGNKLGQVLELRLYPLAVLCCEPQPVGFGNKVRENENRGVVMGIDL